MRSTTTRAGAVGLFAALALGLAVTQPAEAAVPPTGLAFSQLNGVTGDAVAVGLDAAGNLYYAGSGRIPTTPGALHSDQVGSYLISLDPGGSRVRYATYVAGGVADIAVKPDGGVVLAGNGVITTTSGALQQQSASGQGGPFVEEIDPTGSRLVYGTYISSAADSRGFGGNDNLVAVAVDPQGNAYVTGTTDSTQRNGFPVSRDAFQPRNVNADGSSDAFFTVINPTGGLVYGTFLGGRNDGITTNFDEENDFGYGVAVDASGNAYLTGLTGTKGFPNTANLRGAAERQTQNLFVTKFTRNTGALGAAYRLDYSVFPARARAFGIAVDATGSAYVTGETFLGTDGIGSSAGDPAFPSTPGAFQPSRSTTTDSDSFVIKLTPTGRYAYATNLGGNREDQGHAIVVDGRGQAWVGGLTESDAFPVTPNAYQSQRVRTATLPDDGFVTGVNATGTGLVYSTLLTGSGRLNQITDVAVNGTGVVVSGRTTSADFPDSPGGIGSGFCCTGNEFAIDGFVAAFR